MSQAGPPPEDCDPPATARSLALAPEVWAWLDAQPGGAAATVARLAAEAQGDRSVGVDQAAGRFLAALTAAEISLEDAARALLPTDPEAERLIRAWPGGGSKD